MQGRAEKLSATGTWLAACAAAVLGGCAGGAWLERPISAEVPLEGPQTAYPTALRGPTPAIASGLNGQQAVADAASAVLPADATANGIADATSIPAATPAHGSRLERQQSNMPVLAVIPPQYVTHPSPSPAPSLPQPATPLAMSPTSPSSAPPGVASVATVADLNTAVSGIGQVAYTISDLAAEATHQGVTAGNATEEPARLSPLSSNQTTEVKADEPRDVDKEQRELIEALEAEIRRRRDSNATDDELPRLEQQLRLAYVAAGRLDDAVAAVESLDGQQREAYKNLMFGLGIWLSPDEARRAPLRTAKVLTSLREATTDLAAGSKLELRNLVFCERVDYFGWYTEFPRKEFQPKQQVILYVEVQNFAAEQKGPAGYETELHGSYEILDSSGQIVASRQLPPDKEICRNYRRDYFLAYRIYMPDSIAPGHYRLELTVEDLKASGKYQGRKLGEGMIEFTIR